MAKLTGPLLSFDARGSVGKTLVTSNWRGVKYARQYVIPANPRTTAQQANRTRFALLREMYKLAPAEVIAPWTAFATGRPFLPVNKFVGENNRLLNGETTFDNAIMSPGARGGLPPTSVTASTGTSSGEVDVEVIVPTVLPDGWTIDSIVAAAMVDQDPVGLFTGPFVADSDVPPATSITLGGMGSAVDCMCFGWVTYLKPDGLTAYSVSLSSAATSQT